ncbi:hypothetical protein BV20DRAFT_1007839 [Pilatotrama ljubarskyi]|nr:hypothetical protein BV20DRAFT_1007839 [Pilatotrama ljubarskyi]
MSDEARPLKAVWGVLYRPTPSDPCRFLHRYVHKCLPSDNMRSFLDVVFGGDVNQELELLPSKDMRDYLCKFYALPDRPCPVSVPLTELRNAYEGRVNQADFAEGCCPLDETFEFEDVDPKWLENLVLILSAYHHAMTPCPVHTVRTAPRSPASPRSSRLTPAPEEDSYHRSRERIASAGRQRRSPSQEAAPSRLLSTQTSSGEDPIYNGRPIDLTGIPITIYHPAFSTFLRVWNGTEELQRQEIACARRFVTACAEFYDSETDRTEALERGGLPEAVQAAVTILRETTLRLSSTKTITPGGVVYGRLALSSHTPVICFTEVKSEIGQGGCDPNDESQQCYKAFYCSDEGKAFRDVSCCPCLTLAIAGPHIMRAYPYIGPHLRRLRTETGGEILLEYTGALMRDEPRKALFTARADFGDRRPKRDVIVKFAYRYCEKAHRLLAEQAEPLAPRLWFCEKVQSVGMYVVVMDHIKDEDDRETMTAAQRAQLRKAVGLLHEQNLVFGDLRDANLLLRRGGGLMLVDFDWCGEEGKVRYPYDINMNGDIGWHEEVEGGELIKKEHDLHMLHALVESVGGDEEEGAEEEDRSEETRESEA